MAAGIQTGESFWGNAHGCGIGAWWRSGGRTRVEPGARRSERSESWWFGSRERTRGGGYQRIVGELKGLWHGVSATTVRRWLRTQGLGPAGTRGGMTWREFLRVHRRSVLAVDFFTVETIGLYRLFVLVFIELGSRRVHIVSLHASRWTTTSRMSQSRVPQPHPATAKGRPRPSNGPHCPVSGCCYGLSDNDSSRSRQIRSADRF